MWNRPWPWIEPVSLTLAGKLLTTGPLGKSSCLSLLNRMKTPQGQVIICFVWWNIPKHLKQHLIFNKYDYFLTTWINWPFLPLFCWLQVHTSQFPTFLTAYQRLLWSCFLLKCWFLVGVFYLAALGHSCSMWDLVSWPGIEPRPPVLGVWNLSHWTTRKVPVLMFLRASS